MTPASAALFAVATELAKMAKDSMPEMREGEDILREWYTDGVYYRETKFNGEKFISQYDFRQRKSSSYKEDLSTESQPIKKRGKRKTKST